MFNFSSQRPTKQGTKYGLNLGQNDGPFLGKDIMMASHKSIQLLTGNQITRSGTHTGNRSISSHTHNVSHSGKAIHCTPAPHVYDENTGTYTNYSEAYKSHLTASESIGIKSGFENEKVRKLKELLQQYKDVILEYKEELKAMNKRINEANQGNSGGVQPAMRDFYETLKAQLVETKNENYQLQREIDQLNRDKTQIQQQINFSEKRIQDLEKFMGVSAKLDESDESEPLEF